MRDRDRRRRIFSGEGWNSSQTRSAGYGNSEPLTTIWRIGLTQRSIRCSPSAVTNIRDTSSSHERGQVIEGWDATAEISLRLTGGVIIVSFRRGRSLISIRCAEDWSRGKPRQTP